MLDPRLLAGTPHDSRTAFEDLIGQLVLMYAGMTPAVVGLTGVAPKRYPVDAGAKLPDLLQSIQAQHASFAQTLSISAPPDLQSFDLRNASDFASWTFLLSGDLARIKTAAGVI